MSSENGILSPAVTLLANQTMAQQLGWFGYRCHGIHCLLAVLRPYLRPFPTRCYPYFFLCFIVCSVSPLSPCKALSPCICRSSQCSIRGRAIVGLSSESRNGEKAHILRRGRQRRGGGSVSRGARGPGVAQGDGGRMGRARSGGRRYPGVLHARRVPGDGDGLGRDVLRRGRGVPSRGAGGVPAVSAGPAGPLAQGDVAPHAAVV